MFDITRPYYWIKRNTRNVYYEVKYAIQRAFRGYDDIETYSLNDSFIERTPKILKKMRKLGNSYPIEFNSYEEWAKVLDEMICYFELGNEDNPIWAIWEDVYAYNEFYSLNDLMCATKIIYYYRRKALDMFVKYFDNLWD